MDIEAFARRMVELLPRLARGLARHEHNSLSRGDITLPQLWALEHLSRHDVGCPMNELARALSISRPAATGLIDRLIVQKLARRMSDHQDRRIVRVAITAKGQRILTNIWEQKRRTITSVFSQISPDDRAQYLTTLERVVRILTEQESSHHNTAMVTADSHQTYPAR